MNSQAVTLSTPYFIVPGETYTSLVCCSAA